MHPSSVLTLVLAMSIIPSMSLASEADVGPALRAQAEAVCRDDAIRLCADAISDESAIIACMRPKRALLVAPCRKIFDAVVREMGR